MESKKRPLVSGVQAARQLGISKDFLRSLDRSGALPPVIRVPGRALWAQADIDRVKAGVLADGRGNERGAK